jgi:hypothetical protein
MRLNHFSRRIFASTATGGDWQAHLDFEQRDCALIDGLADLAVADGIAHANVHGWLSIPATGVSRYDWRSCKNKCE